MTAVVDAGTDDTAPLIETTAGVDGDAFPWLAVDFVLVAAGVGVDDEH